MIKTIARIASALAPLSALALAAPALAAPAAAPATPAPAAPAATAPAAAPIIKLPLLPTVGTDMRACTNKTASGLGYTVLRDASGPKPGKSDYVLIDYIGYLTATGAVFDQNRRVPLSLGGVIPGFAEGLQLMPRGAVWRLCVPAALGYGAQGAGESIPANSDLVFQIELIDSKTMAEVEALREAQQKAQAEAEAKAKPQK